MYGKEACSALQEMCLPCKVGNEIYCWRGWIGVAAAP